MNKLSKRKLEHYAFLFIYAIFGAFMIFMYLDHLGPSLFHRHQTLFAHASDYPHGTFIEKVEYVNYYLICIIQVLMCSCLVLICLGIYHALLILRLLKSNRDTLMHTISKNNSKNCSST